MTKKELLEGLELFYTGKGFAGFREENPFVTFLRFDKKRLTRFWVKYGGRTVFTSLKNVVLKSEVNPAI